MYFAPSFLCVIIYYMIEREVLSVKLKRVVKSDDNWQRCCRWCHYYQNGKCWNKDVAYNYQNGLDVYSVAENGYSSQAIEEVLNSDHLRDQFMYSLMEVFDKWKISGKRKAEFMEHYKECWGEFADMTLKEKLDEAVSIVYQSRLDPYELEFEGTYIDDPNEFCCKEWC